MSEQKQQETKKEELTTEQLDKVAGGFNPVDGIKLPTPPLPFGPIDGKV